MSGPPSIPGRPRGRRAASGPGVAAGSVVSHARGPADAQDPRWRSVRGRAGHCASPRLPGHLPLGWGCRRRAHGRRALEPVAHPRRARHLPGGRGPARAPLGGARGPPRGASGRGGNRVRRMGALGPGGAGGGRMERLGRPGPSDADARGLGRVGDLRARGARRAQVQVRGARRGRIAAPEGRSPRHRQRGAARHGQRDLPIELRVGRRRVDSPPRRRQALGRADGGLRGAPRLVAPAPRRQLPRLRRARRGPRRPRGGPRLHTRGAAAAHGASLRPVVGLPGVELLRTQRPLRRSRRLPVPGRPPAPPGDRRAHRLGPRPLPP